MASVAQPEFLPAVEEPQPLRKQAFPGFGSQRVAVRGQGLKRILDTSAALLIALILVIAALAFLLVKSKFDGGTQRSWATNSTA
jgi:hypothetical protein